MPLCGSLTRPHHFVSDAVLPSLSSLAAITVVSAVRVSVTIALSDAGAFRISEMTRSGCARRASVRSALLPLHSLQQHARMPTAVRQKQ